MQMPLSLTLVQDSASIMDHREDEEVYIFTRDVFVSSMRSRLTAADSATEAEQWARQFSRSLVRLLH